MYSPARKTPYAVIFTPKRKSTPVNAFLPSHKSVEAAAPAMLSRERNNSGKYDNREIHSTGRRHFRRREITREPRLRAGVEAPHERLFELRDFLLDHLHPRRRHHVAPAWHEPHRRR